jgi:hypothetical protein
MTNTLFLFVIRAKAGAENVGLEPMRLFPALALDRRVQYPHW